ncbi:hypothetical protein [Sorangium cellulosum]|uniref:Uncharacterized protein n=1 Tax=Sorangium cellulosum TaxID=56 RepID=A0A150QS72_SORCE|nr:hypothetical protein [Sorangium cellulosum]KYF70867.1 hypothetical protein BE15_30645 [Sorangium cellulosum]
MARSRHGLAEIVTPAEAAEPGAEAGRGPELAVVRPAEPAAPQLVAVRLEAFDEEAGRAVLRVGAEAAPAAIDPSVEPAVLRTALQRRERVIAQQEQGGWVVLGALRTSATPGVDEGDEFVIRARRIALLGASEVSLVSGMSSVVLRAFGFVETLGQDITARASGVHKIVGRMIRLN